ncbi:MAG: hypothetical protein RIR17_1514, partial [Planctomycetota bacterium]
MSPHLIPHRFPRLAYILFGGMLGILIIATGNASLAKSGTNHGSAEIGSTQKEDGLN